MKPTTQLHDLGQSIWLDQINRELLTSGTLQHYIEDLSVTGLTSNPTIFEHALKDSAAYDEAIGNDLSNGKTGETLFFDLAIDDLRAAADLFQPVYRNTGGVDGWVSLEVSPLIAHDSAATLSAAQYLFAWAERKNLHIKIPGTKAGLPAIEEATFAGIPVNVTLLFSSAQYLAAAEAWLRGIERRIEAGLDPDVRSVASVFVSRWDVATARLLPPELNHQLGRALAGRIYATARALHASPRWQRVQNAGTRLQRLLWASTGTKDPAVRDTVYVETLNAPYTVNTLPEKTLLAFADHGVLGTPLAIDGSAAESIIARCVSAGVDVEALATQLQDDGAKAFVRSWKGLLAELAAKSAALASVS